MKNLLALHIILLGGFLCLGFYLMKVKEQLVEELFKVGWESYDGLSLDVPSNVYSVIGMLCTLYAIFVGVKIAEEISLVGFFMMGLGASFFVFAMVMFFQDGSTSVKESILAWEVYVGLAFLLTVIGFFGGKLPRRQKVYHSNILDDFNE
jgi:hypothetical protein